MTISKQIPIETKIAILKLKDSLEQISNKIDVSNFSEFLSESMALIRKFYDEVGSSGFNPIEFKKGDIPRADVYNENLNQIFNDLNRFYLELENLNSLAIKSYNYSQVVIEEIKRRAQDLASIVLDLNILNNFSVGDAIVAGDDFINKNFIDSSANYATNVAEILPGGYGVTLSRNGSQSVLDGATIDVFPIEPKSKDSNVVNTTPTPGNIERFYEGCYYEFLGSARPEGGNFKFRYINLNTGSVTATIQTEPDLGMAVTGDNSWSPEQPTFDTLTENGYFVIDSTNNSSKAKSRLKMIDGNAETFWECEYVLKLPDPLYDLSDVGVSDKSINSSEIQDDEQSASSEVTEESFEIDAENLNLLAQEQDSVNLTIDIVFTLKTESYVNFLSINPVIYSKNANIEILDISTSNSDNGTFSTIDGWDSLRFAKTITPEANEFLTDSQAAAVLAPNKTNYSGQGIFPFPTRFAKKIKIRVRSALPVAQIYERVYVLMKNVADIDLVFHKRTRRGF